MHYFHILFIFDDSFFFHCSAYHIVEFFFLNDCINNYHFFFQQSYQKLLFSIQQFKFQLTF